MTSMDQYSRFGGFSNPGAGIATTTQPMGQPVPAQMMQMSGLPPNLTCALSPVPVQVQCPFCQSVTTTTTEREPGLRAKLMACAFCSSGLCCLIPLCWNNFKDTVHYCGNCQREIGRCARAQGTTGRMRQQ